MDVIAIDLETYYDKAFSLSKLTTEEYIRDPRFQTIGAAVKVNGGPTQWRDASEEVSFAAWLHSFDWANSALLAHNTMFDGAILAWRYGIKPARYLDTLSMARPVTGMTVGCSLKALATHFGLGQKGTEVLDAIGKRLEDFTATELIRYGGYCCNDVDLTRRLFGKLKDRTTPREIELIDSVLRMFIEPSLELDVDLLERHLSSVQLKKAQLLEQVESIAGKDALMSNVKLAEVLRGLGVEPPMKNSVAAAKRGEVKMTYAFGKTDKAFTALLDHDNAAVQAIVAARLGVKSTLEETRTERLIALGRRGRMPVPLQYYGAFVTGRLSGADKLNFQNMPRKGTIRKAIRAPHGKSIVACDSSNIELRVNHTLAGQLDSVEAFRDKRDLYCEFATILYGRPITKADIEERQMGKLAHLSLGYGCGWERFRDICRLNKVFISEEESKRVVNLWRATYDCIPKMWKAAERMIGAIARGESGPFQDLLWFTGDGILLPSGRLISYPGLRRTGDGWEYMNRREWVKLYGAKVIENICQALAADIICDQWLAIKQQYPVALQVHDELVFVVDEMDADRAVKFAECTMSIPPAWWPQIPLAAEAKAAQRYGDAK